MFFEVEAFAIIINHEQAKSVGVSLYRYLYQVRYLYGTVVVELAPGNPPGLAAYRYVPVLSV
jgi:hypothetical protein